jgi:hypothetical protein
MSVDDLTNSSSPDSSQSGESFTRECRWYDQDPLLSEVLELLRAYPMELHYQAEQFMQRLQDQLGADVLDRFYEQAKPRKIGQRWYDEDPVLFRAIELLRVVPQEVQRHAAQRFLEAIRKQGLNPDLLREQANAEQTLRRAIAEEGPLPLPSLDTL